MNENAQNRIEVKSEGNEPKGLFVFRKSFDPLPLQQFLDQQQFYPITTNGREVIQYGKAYNYQHGSSTIPVLEVPAIIDQLMTSTLKVAYNSVIVNKYVGDQGISEHIDSDVFGGIIACFIVGDGAEIEFRRDEERYKIYLRGGDIYVMTGSSRYLWTHQIRKRKHDLVDGKRIPRGTRYSITYRERKN